MNIATLANNLPKIKKDFLIDDLVNYYNENSLNDGGNEELQRLLAYCYKQFLPSVKVNKKENFSWVAQAMAGKTDCRYYLQYVYCDGDRIIATNGRILLISPNDRGLQVGYYDKAKNRVDCDATYPNVDRIIPRIEDRTKSIKVDLGTITIKDNAAKYGGAIITDDQDRFIVGANIKYLKMIGRDEFTIHCGGSEESILYKEGDRMAVIMPMRL